MKTKVYLIANPKIDIKLIIILLLTSMLLSHSYASAAPHTAGWSISLNPDNGYPGNSFTVKLKDFTGGYAAAIRWDGVDQITFTMPDSGQYATTLTVPSGASPGVHTVSACNNCGGGDFEEYASAVFEVRELPPVTLPISPISTSTFTPMPPTPTFTPIPPSVTPTPTLVPETETPSPSPEPTETQSSGGGEKALPGEVFVDQLSLSLPSCTPNETNFYTYISDPTVNPRHVSLLILPPGGAPLLGIQMVKDEFGMYVGRLQLDEDDNAGEWQYSVLVLDESGASYRSEMGTLAVHACGEESPGLMSSDQLIELLPYFAIGLLAFAALGLIILGVVLAVVRIRRR